MFFDTGNTFSGLNT